MRDQPYRVVGLGPLTEEILCACNLQLSPAAFKIVLRSPEDGARPSKDYIRTQVEKCNERPLTATGQRVSLDKDTLKWRSWRPQGQHSSIVPAEGAVDRHAFDQPLHKITANEFRKLSNQVRDVSSASVTSLRSTIKKPYPRHGSSDKASQLYRSQLASSLKTFKNKHWTPYESEASSNNAEVPVRSRPGSSLSEARPPRPSRPGSSYSRFGAPTPPPGPRPKSSPPEIAADHQDSLQVRSDSPKDAYDTLRPDIVYDLSEGPRPGSVYGDRPQSAVDREIESEDDDLSQWGDSRPSTANVIDQSVTTDTDYTKEAGAYSHISTKAWDVSANSAGDITDKDTDIDSDEEDYPEPAVRRMDIGDLPNLSLRPEKVDSLDIAMYSRGDRRKYDFDASVVESPQCEFSLPLSPALEEIDLKSLSMREKNWRVLIEAQPEDDTEGAIIDRLIEFERLQMKTVEWENARQDRMRAIRQRQQRSKVYQTARVQSAKTWREKKCCVDCLQPACVGDCPNKPMSNSTVCIVCSEQNCDGDCFQSVYNSRSRAEYEEEKPKPRLKPRPKSCTSCQSRHTAKMINANNLVLGRPKSGNITFCRGQSSSKPKDLRPTSGGEINTELQEDFERLGIDPTSPEDNTEPGQECPSRPGTAISDKRHSGRAGVIPGKSYFSQRRVSLTERDYQFEKAKMIANKRIRSARRRRPKTAT